MTRNVKTKTSAVTNSANKSVQTYLGRIVFPQLVHYFYKHDLHPGLISDLLCLLLLQAKRGHFLFLILHLHIYI